MSRPIEARISLGALKANYRVAKRLAPHSSLLAVVKANAYGHGIERVARALSPVDGFGTLELDGAVKLRERYQTVPILLLEGFFEASELPQIAASRLAVTLHCEEQLRMLELSPPREPLEIWFKVNTGMNRLGFALTQVRAMLERLEKSRVAKSITLMTHFARAEAPGGIEEAMRRFDSVTAGLNFPRSLANSAAIFTQPASHADAVRLGIALYGATPFADRSAASLRVRPAMTLSSRLIAIQDLGPDESVGYGGEFRSARAMRVGVAACGYADGYPRHAPSGTPILVGGVRTQTVGRVSMDMITVDLTPVPQAKVGTPVELWGEGLPIDQVAKAAGTVGYELMCALAPRVPVTETETP
ncbi:MAG TPA: alanine racemase [Usitatibacter sp.]|nr:alanine racemase [Usitatibacter sp.]